MTRIQKYAGLLLAFLACVTACAQDTHDIDITIRLQQDGTALVTQVWDVQCYQGTEFFIPVGVLKDGMLITDFTVAENEEQFQSEGRDWKIDRSREEKAGKCGIVDKSDGSLELCWGIGSTGPHKWILNYTLQNLVQSFDECDGFGFEFLGDELPGPPEHARVTVLCDFDTPGWNPGENVGGWSFGFKSDLSFEGNVLIAESTESFVSASRVALMMRFEKGMFQGLKESPVSWGKFQKSAFKGSDYKRTGGFGGFLRWMWEDAEGLGGIVFATIVVAFILIFSWIRRKYILMTGNRYRPSVFGATKIEGWWRDAPLGGSLPAAYSLLSEGDRLKENYDKGLMGAYFLKWIQDGILHVVKVPGDKRRVNLTFNPGEGPVFTDPVEISLYNMAARAAGNNLVLESGEFEQWSRQNYQEVVAWPGTVKMQGKGIWMTAPMNERQNVVKLKNYLKDFTLLEERDAEQVHLWKYYMVYAQLLGIAEEVAKNFEKLYPAEFKEYTHGMRLDDGVSYYTLLTASRSYSYSLLATAQAKQSQVQAEQRRSSGGGGRGSFGGGRGFSGGGAHGGGTR